MTYEKAYIEDYIFNKKNDPTFDEPIKGDLIKNFVIKDMVDAIIATVLPRHIGKAPDVAQSYSTACRSQHNAYLTAEITSLLHINSPY